MSQEPRGRAGASHFGTSYPLNPSVMVYLLLQVHLLSLLAPLELSYSGLISSQLWIACTHKHATPSLILPGVSIKLTVLDEQFPSKLFPERTLLGKAHLFQAGHINHKQLTCWWVYSLQIVFLLWLISFSALHFLVSRSEYYHKNLPCLFDI